MRLRVDDVAAQHAATRVERLLLAAAEFEPETPAPSALTSGGILMLLAEDAQRRRRRTVRARVAALTGLMAGTAACSASLVMALTQPARSGIAPAVSTTVPLPVPEKTQVASGTPAPTSGTAEAPEPKSKSRTVRRKLRHRRRPAAKQEAASPPVWTEQTVEHQVTGLLANAWVVEPQADGSLQISPAIIDLPTEAVPTADACGPEGAEIPMELPATPADEAN